MGQTKGEMIVRVFSARHRINLSISHRGNKPTERTRAKLKKAKSLQNHPNWKGGRKFHERGYVLIRVVGHPNADSKGYVREHRLVMEKHLGRYLKKTEIVHHVNKDIKDNRIENLILFQNQKEHLGYHKKERKSLCVGSYPTRPISSQSS